MYVCLSGYCEQHNLRLSVDFQEIRRVGRLWIKEQLGEILEGYCLITTPWRRYTLYRVP